MIATTWPPLWSSAHRPVVWEFDFYTQDFSATNNSGFAQFTVSQFYLPFTVGQKIRITSGIYEGVHTITQVVSSKVIVADATFTSAASGQLQYLKVPPFKLYKGYKSSEEYPSQLPETLVATWTPEYTTDYNVRVDVSEYLRSIFRIIPPTEGIDFNMFNRFRLTQTYTKPGTTMIISTIYRQVINSSIKTEDLNSDFVETGSFLNSKEVPIVFGCGKTILSTLEGNVVTNNYINNADILTESDGDFSGDDFNLEFNIN